MTLTPGMRETTEVRWFGPGRPPDPIERWIREQAPAARVEERVDLYLRVDGCAGVGIKLREGVLEVKGRGQSEAIRVGIPPVHGLVERWRKWTGGPARESELFIGADGCTVQVPKRRVRVGIEAGHDSWGLAPISEGCEGAIELTEVTVHAGRYWTVAVELFRWTNASVLADAVHGTMNRFPWGELAGLRSQGYAEFLDHRAAVSREGGAAAPVVHHPSTTGSPP